MSSEHLGRAPWRFDQRLLGAVSARKRPVGLAFILIGSVSVIYNLLTFTYSAAILPEPGFTYVRTYAEFAKVGIAVGGAMIIGGLVVYYAGRNRSSSPSGVGRLGGEGTMSRPLVRGEAMQCFGISVALSAFLLATAMGLVYLLKHNTDREWAQAQAWIPVCAGLGGLFGGVGRSLIMFISEIGVHRNPLSKPQDPQELLSRWALYLIAKPFAGLMSGVLFFFAVKYGLVQALAGKSEGEPISVFFVAAIGGVAFEEAIRLSDRLVGR